MGVAIVERRVECLASSAPSDVIFCMVDGKSALNSSLAINKALAGIGFRIIYLGPATDAEYILAQGFKYLSYSEPSFPSEPSKGSPISKIRQSIRKSLSSIYCFYEQIERWYEQFNPRLVLLDSNLLIFSLPFLKRKVRIINLNATLAYTWTTTSPPVFSTYAPASHATFSSRAVMAALWAKVLASRYFQTIALQGLTRVGFGLSAKCPNILKEIRQHGGRIQWTEYGPRLQAPELVFSPEEFDFPYRRNTPNWLYVGAGVDMNRQDGQFDWGRLSPDKKLVYCSLGTCSTQYSNREQFYRSVIGAIRKNASFQLILNVQEDSLREKLDPKIPNIILTRRVPQLEVLQRTDIFISQGGFNSIKESLCLGVPLIIFPGWHDQFGNAARVEYHRLGLRGDMRKISADGLLGMIDAISKDDGIAQRLQAMKKYFLQSNDCRKGVEFIANMLQVPANKM